MSSVAIYADNAFIDGVFRSASVGVPGEPRIRLDGRYFLLPGLVNSHDHLQFNSFPLLGPHAPYADMYEWAADIQHDSPEIRRALKIPIEDRLRIGGLKNLISGVTTVAHHDTYHPCFENRFPVRVGRNYSWSHSPGFDTNAAATFRNTPCETPWMIHVAEGVSERASAEIDGLERIGLVAQNTVLIHALAATPSQMERIRDHGASIVTCPVSNRYLYGTTFDFNALPAGSRIALGSDSAATSSPGILEDLKVVCSLVDWPEQRLWSMVTVSPRSILRLPPYHQDFT